jgi:autoinducer 2-degrading protein
MVILSGFISVASEQIDSIKSALPIHISQTQQEPGCITFRVTQRKIEPHIFDVYEEFSDMHAFEAHQQRVKNADWGIVSKDVQRHYTVEEI